MRKILSVILSFCILSIIFFAASLTASAATGDWSSNTTAVTVGNITINTPGELAGFAAKVNEGNPYSGYTVTLGGNIDLSAHYWTAIGSSSHPFFGTFNGAGYTISGLNYSGTSMFDYGLFGYINGATVKNVSVSGTVNINDTGIYSYESGVAIIVGYMKNSSVIDNCSSGGTVTVSYTSSDYVIYPNVAGIAGSNYTNGTIKNSKNTANITVTVQYKGDSDNAGSQIRAGGIAGRNNASTIINCYNSGSISGTATNTIAGSASVYNGGIVGFFDSGSPAVSNCYNTGNITANTSAPKTKNSYKGGIVGIGSSTAAQYCYWLSSTATYAYGYPSATVANTSAFTGTGTLSTSTTSLLTALNNWVTANSGRGGLFWEQDSSYPVLDDTYTITYNLNEGTINDSSYPTAYIYGAGAALPTDITQIGYTFAGWYDNAGFNGTAITQVSSTAIGNKTYYAKWTIPYFTVSGTVSGLITNSGVEVSYSGSVSGSVTTDIGGNYIISNIPYGGSVNISVVDVQYFSKPIEIDLSSITANATGQNLAYTKNYNVMLSFVSASAIKDATGTGTLRYITKMSITGDAPDAAGFGTYIVPLSLFTAGQYSNTADVYYDNGDGSYASSIKDGVTYSADLTDIPSLYSGTTIMAISYVTLSNGDTVITEINTTSVDESLKQ